MRNLKRALSLAMASVMLLGMMVVGTSAGYDDVSSKENQEAIEVLQAVGIMTGDENGNFNPNANVTRNEMAVVMSNLMDYRVATYAGTSPFTDVPDWAEPYVAACYTNGITAGYSATIYAGNNTVTTSEAALMLMKALGYFQYQSDFEEDWQFATVKQAGKIDLFKGVDSGVTEAMTRNDVARLVLNTLKSGMVEPDDDTIKVESGDVSVVAGSIKYNYITSDENYALAIKQVNASGSLVNSGQAIVELGEKLYQGDLRMDDAAGTIDNFGRPATAWTLKYNEIGSYAKQDELLNTYTDKVTRGTLYSLVGRTNVNKLGNGATLSVYADGQPVNAPTVSNYFSLNSSSAAGVANTTGVAGKGVQTEVYINDDGHVTIVFINTYVAQANGDYRESSGSLNTITLTQPAAFAVGTLEVDDFDNLVDFADEDYILYTASYNNGTWTVETVKKAEIVTGEVTAYSEGDDVSLDGTTYAYAAQADTDSKNTTYVVGNTASIVLDPYGYAIYVDDASVDVGNYVYVDGIIQKSGFGSDYLARVYTSDGTVKEVTINKMYNKNSSSDNDKINLGNYTLGTSTNAADSHKLDGWYSYSVNSDNEYTLKRAANTSVAGTTRVEYTSGTVMTGEVVKFLTGEDVRGNNATVFIVDDGDDVTVYTGINNAPEIAFPASPDGSVYVSWMLSKDKAGNYASLVWVSLTEDANASVDGATTDEVLFVLNRASVGVNSADGTRIETWNAIVNGTVTKIKAEEGDLSAYTMYEKYRVDSDGYYEGTLFDGTKTKQVEYTLTKGADNTATGNTVSYSDGSLTLGGHSYTVTNDTQIVLVLQDATGSGACTKNNSNNLGDKLGDNIVLMADDPAAKHLTYTGLTGKGLENFLKGYSLDGTFYGVLADSDKDELVTLYVVITDAVRYVAP